MGFPGGSAVKNLSANAGDASSVPGSERSSGEGNGNPLQYSCLGNPMDREAWRATVHGVTKELDKTKRLKNNNKRPFISARTSPTPNRSSSGNLNSKGRAQRLL